uniref:ABC transporter A family member 9-like n=1 Tax=Tanacetum cinerariifolium TaxID=118510 RepID=A0A6L2JBU8_TANCI|nr:ABC transporter A family member 9-like [Tanacetum cinerariifolium]
MRTCPPHVFESAQRFFNVAVRSSLDRIVTAFGLGFDDWQWRLAALPFAFGRLGTKLLWHIGIVAFGPNFDDALSMFNTSMETDLLCNQGCDKPLRPADMLLYSWDGGLDVCVDVTGSSPLTQTRMADFVPGRAVIDAAQRKCGKYMAKCAAIGYGFLPFSFFSLGELEADEVTLLKRIRKFSMAQDIGAHAAVHIFNRISFAIAKGVGAR